MTTCQ